MVTGAASGLGKASAMSLAGQGAHVVAVDVNGTALRDVVGSLPTRSVAVEGDVAEEQTVERYMQVATGTFGHVDLHHLNAGIFGSLTPLPDLTVDEFDRVMDVNVRGQFLGLRAAFRQYRAQGARGAIVLTASIASLTGSADLLAYQTSKHSVVGLIHGAAMYGGPLGIRVNGVAPGIVPTELFAAAALSVGGKNDMVRRAATTPLRRAGTARRDSQRGAVPSERGVLVHDRPGVERRWRCHHRQYGPAVWRCRGLGHGGAGPCPLRGDKTRNERQ